MIEVKDMSNIVHVTACEDDFHLCVLGEGTQEPGCKRENQLRALAGSFYKSVKQRKKIVDVIKCIEEVTNIFQFTAYPNFSKRFQKEFPVLPEQLSTILFKEDVDDLSVWWKEFLAPKLFGHSCDEKAVYHANHERVKKILLAVWCAEENVSNFSKCSIGKCIKDIDQELEKSNIIFISKNREANHAVVDAPNIIKKYLGVNHLTGQQIKIFNSKEAMLWINGPAGSGKTIIISGKMIEYIRSSENHRVVLLTSGGSSSSRKCQTAFEKAEIKYNKIVLANKDEVGLVDAQTLIVQSNLSNPVVIVQLGSHLGLPKLTKLLTFIPKLVPLSRVFLDDLQNVLVMEELVEFIKFFKMIEDLSHSLCSLWIACDVVQCFYLMSPLYTANLATCLMDSLSPNRRPALTSNLRSKLSK